MSKALWRGGGRGLTAGLFQQRTPAGDSAYKLVNEFWGPAGYSAVQTIPAFTQVGTITTGSVAGRDCVANQTIPAFTQSATAINNYRVATASQTLAPITQVAIAGAPSRVITEGVLGDPNFSSVLALLHADGSGTTDSSSYARALTLTGLTVAGSSSAQNKFGGGAFEFSASGSFEQTGHVYTSGASADFDFGSSDFTLEGYARLNSFTTVGMGPRLVITNEFGSVIWTLGVTNSLIPTVFVEIGSTKLVAAAQAGGRFLVDTWHHLAVTRVGTTLRLFLDRKLVATGTYSGAVPAGGRQIRAYFASGAMGVTDAAFRGWWDEIRVTTGLGRYTASGDAETAAFPGRGAADPLRLTQTATVTTGTTRRLSTNDDASFTARHFLLHGDSVAADPDVGGHVNSTDSGPYRIKGRGQYVTANAVPGAFGGNALQFEKLSGWGMWESSPLPAYSGTIDITTEFRFRITEGCQGWVLQSGEFSIGLAGGLTGYPTDSAGSSVFNDQTGFSYFLQFSGGSGVSPAWSATAVFGRTPLSLNEWHHVALVRSGTSVKVYLDGMLELTYTLPSGASMSGNSWQFGNRGIGYFAERTPVYSVEEVRHTLAAIYSGEVFDVPTAPFADTQVMAAVTQTATVVHPTSNNATAAQTIPAFTQTATLLGVRVINGTQTLPAITQVATAVNGSAAVAVAAQTLPAFGQVATAIAVPIPGLAGTQFMPAIAQTAFAGDARDLTNLIFPSPLGRTLPAFAQDATATSSLSAAAAQTLPISQVATVVHAGVGAAAAQAMQGFGQAATAAALLKLTAGQIILPPTQNATMTGLRKLSGAQLLPQFGMSALIEGAPTNTSSRGYRVRPEARTHTI